MTKDLYTVTINQVANYQKTLAIVYGMIDYKLTFDGPLVTFMTKGNEMDTKDKEPKFMTPWPLTTMPWPKTTMAVGHNHTVLGHNHAVFGRMVLGIH